MRPLGRQIPVLAGPPSSESLGWPGRAMPPACATTWGEAEPGAAQDIHECHSDGDELRPGRTPSCSSSCVEAGWGTARVVHTGPGWQKWRWKPCTQLQAAASLPWRQRHLVAPRPRGGRARPHGGRRRRSAWSGRAAIQEGAWRQGCHASFSVSFNRVLRPFRGQKHRLNLVKAYILVYILCNTKL